MGPRFRRTWGAAERPIHQLPGPSKPDSSERERLERLLLRATALTMDGVGTEAPARDPLERR